MKKIIFVLLTFIGISFAANAQNSCPIYGSNGANATLLTKGDQANASGYIYLSVKVSNYKQNSSEGRSVDVWVEIRDQDTGCVATRECLSVWIKPHYYDGTSQMRVSGLTPGKDYLFNIDSAKTCE